MTLARYIDALDSSRQVARVGAMNTTKSERRTMPHLRSTHTASRSDVFKVLLGWERESQLWVTYVPSLDYLSSCGSTREEALNKTKAAITAYVKAAQDDGMPWGADQPEPELVNLVVSV